MNPKTRRTLSFISVMSATFLSVLNTNMIRVASPTIQNVFSVDAGELAWVFNGYMLLYSLVMPLAGQLGDAGDRKKMFEIGLVIFLAGATFSAISPTYPLLIVARVIQGLGSGFIFPNALVLATSLYPPEQKGRVIGIWGTSGSVAGMIGPSLAGFLVQYLGWRSIFYVNLPVGAAALVLLRVFHKGGEAGSAKSDVGSANEGENRRSKITPDIKGTAVFASSIGCLLTAFWELGSGGSIPQALGLAGLAVILLVVFFRMEHKVANPIVDPKLFGRRDILTTIGCGMLFMAINQSVPFLLPLFMNGILGMTPAAVGLMMLPSALIRIIASPMGGTLTDKMGARFPACVGLLCMGLGCAMFALMTPQTASWYVSLTLLVFGIGDGMMWSSNLAGLLKLVPQAISSSVTGVYNMARFLAGIIGSTSIGLVLDARFRGVTATTDPVAGYWDCFAVLVGIALVGTALASTLTKAKSSSVETGM